MLCVPPLGGAGRRDGNGGFRTVHHVGGERAPTPVGDAPIDRSTEPVGVGGGVTLRRSHPMDILALLEVYVLDVYEAGQLPGNAIVFDLGAGIGDFSVLAARRVQPGGIVLAVEPSPRDFPLLLENLGRNGSRNVRARNVALGDVDGTIQLQFKGESFDARTVSPLELLGWAGLTRQRIAGRPLALKLDIEGGEVAALEAFRPLLPQVVSVAIELHGTRGHVDAILGEFGFEFHRLGRGRYLLRSLWFLLRHPVDGVRLWREYRRSGRYAGVTKILRGIDIATSEGLQVGVYRRPPRPAR